MNSSIPMIFDAQQRRRQRQKLTAGDHDILLRRSAEDIAERVIGMTRDFDNAFIFAPDILEDLFSSELKGKVKTLHFESSNRLTAKNPEHWAFAAETYDLIIIHWELHCVNDLPGSLLQIRRALKPDGLFLACLPGGDTLSTLRQSFLAADSQTLNGAIPRIHPFATLQDLAGLMQRAGFALPVVDSDNLRVRYDDALFLLRDIQNMGEGTCLIERGRHSLRRDTLMAMRAHYEDHFTDPDGRVYAYFYLLYATGWAPHESQQKPLKPGSATTRLADALNTTEIKISD